jgi:trk system potassium uptake protein TrkH
MRGSKTAFGLWRAVALVGAAPLHAFLLLAVHDAAGARSGAFGTWTDLILYSLYGAVTGWAAVGFLSGRGGPGMWGLTAAILLLPKYIWVFPDCWPLALAGILLCLAHGRYVMRRPAPDADSGADAAGLLVLSCWAALFVAVVSRGYGLAADGSGQGIVWLIVGASVAGSLLYDVSRRLRAGRRPLPLPLLLLVLAVACAAHPQLRRLLLPVLVLRQTLVGAQVWKVEGGGDRVLRHLLERPAQLFASSFALVIGCGAIGLSLPMSGADGRSIGAVDALFTATSATCVTGLVVRPTGEAFSLMGQLTILGLIQVGGLGVMTITTFIALLLQDSIGMKGEFAVQEMVGERRTRSALRLLRFIVLTTLCVEAAGVLVLGGGFLLLGETPSRAAYLGLFHAVSAFCNAGFSPFADSLAGGMAAPCVLLPVSVLVILGGLGFSVVFALVRRVRQRQPVGLHARLVLATTVLLLAGGTLLFWGLERNGVLAGYGPGASWMHAWFQAVTPRTAGFNSVDLAGLGAPARLLLLILMFIGAAPGSTAGGIKVTTLAVLLLVVRSVVNDRDAVCTAGRRLSTRTVHNAVTILFLGLALVSIATGLLILTEPGQSPGVLLFEAVSGFGTVGLSLGATAKLTTAGRLIMVMVMFIGRVGPLTLLLVARPALYRSRVDYPEASVMIG